MIAALPLLFCASLSAFAQGLGEVSVSVHDQSGAALPGVRVTIHGSEEREARTDAGGAFLFQGLGAGGYEISAELTGFESAHRAVRLQAGERTSVSFTLHVAIAEETVVTAAKEGPRDLLTIPMAISAIPASELDRLGTRKIDEAAALAPSVTFSQNTGFAQLTIRGIGTNAVYAGSDPSSAVYLDGVYLARPAMDLVSFLDLERVEVLRGPQGTLYGRNAVGGAVNLISRPPANDFEASADFTAGNFGELRAGARVSGPLSQDRVLGSLALTRGVRDGYVRDLEHPEHPLGGDDVTAARGELRTVLDRRTDLLLSGDVDGQDGTPLTYNKVLAVKPGFHVDNPPDVHDVRASALAWNRTRQSGASARLTMAIAPSTTLVSLTAYRTLDFEFFADADVTEIDLLTTHQHERQHQVSEELTLSHEQSRVSWVAGAFLFAEDDDQTFRVDQRQAQFQIHLDPHVKANSGSAFGQATVALTSRLSATAGIRYTHEGKDIDNAGGRYAFNSPDTPIPGSSYGYSDSIAHDAWTPKIVLEMKLGHDALAYASATRGFKSGGFNPSSTAPGRGYAPEWAWSYEAGWKGELARGRSRFDVSAFNMDYTNLQVQTPIAVGVFDIRNAAAATIRGVEATTTSQIGHGIAAGGHIAWLDAVYDQYIAVDNSNRTGDVSGNRLNNAPEWSGRLWLEWSRDLVRSRRLVIAADWTAQSTVYYTPFNDSIQRQTPYSLLGGRVEYGASDRRWTLAAYARNLTDTDYITGSFGTSPVAFGGRPGPPRQVSVEFAVRR